MNNTAEKPIPSDLFGHLDRFSKQLQHLKDNNLAREDSLASDLIYNTIEKFQSSIEQTQKINEQSQKIIEEIRKTLPKEMDLAQSLPSYLDVKDKIPIKGLYEASPSLEIDSDTFFNKSPLNMHCTQDVFDPPSFSPDLKEFSCIPNSPLNFEELFSLRDSSKIFDSEANNEIEDRILDHINQYLNGPQTEESELSLIGWVWRLILEDSPYFDPILSKYWIWVSGIFYLGENTTSISLPDTLATAREICRRECALEWAEELSLFFRGCVANVLQPILEKISPEEISSPKLKSIRDGEWAWQDDGFDVLEKTLYETYKHDNYVAYYRRCPKGNWKQSSTKFQQKALKIERINANLEDIFFSLQDFTSAQSHTLMMNSNYNNFEMFQPNYLFLWGECAAYQESKLSIRSLYLYSPDTWCRFVANLTEFFNVNHYQPLQERICQSKRSQEIHMMKISATMCGDRERDSNLVSCKIQKFPKDQNSKRYYRKKSKYWKERKFGYTKKGQSTVRNP